MAHPWVPRSPSIPLQSMYKTHAGGCRLGKAYLLRRKTTQLRSPNDCGLHGVECTDARFGGGSPAKTSLVHCSGAVQHASLVHACFRHQVSTRRQGRAPPSAAPAGLFAENTWAPAAAAARIAGDPDASPAASAEPPCWDPSGLGAHPGGSTVRRARKLHWRTTWCSMPPGRPGAYAGGALCNILHACMSLY